MDTLHVASLHLSDKQKIWPHAETPPGTEETLLRTQCYILAGITPTSDAPLLNHDYINASIATNTYSGVFQASDIRIGNQCIGSSLGPYRYNHPMVTGITPLPSLVSRPFEGMP